LDGSGVLYGGRLRWLDSWSRGKYMIRRLVEIGLKVKGK